MENSLLPYNRILIHVYERNDENNVPLGRPIVNDCSWQEASMDAEIVS